jgi:2'-5' RNA ligase
LFFALWPDAATVHRLQAWIDTARATCGGRAMRPDTLHLTLAFLGNVDAGLADSLAGETARRPLTPGAFELSRYGAFRRPRVVYAGPDPHAPAAAALAQAWNSLWDWVAPASGLARPAESFVPHVTLLRDADTAQLPQESPAPLVWRYQRYVLVISEFDGRARYRVLATSP